MSKLVKTVKFVAKYLLKTLNLALICVDYGIHMLMGAIEYLIVQCEAE